MLVDSDKGFEGRRRMEIVCQDCRNRFKIADENLPPERIFSVKCPKCERRLEIHAQPEAQTATRVTRLEPPANEVESRTYDASEKPFDYVHAGVQTALLLLVMLFRTILLPEVPQIEMPSSFAIIIFSDIVFEEP